MAPHEPLLRSLSQPLDPVPTNIEPVLPKLTGILVVLLDIYGTLLVSGSGDIGTTTATRRDAALAAALDAVGIPLAGPAETTELALVDTIAQHHARLREQGVDHPEIDIVDVWRDTLVRLAADGQVAHRATSRDILERLAIEYEARINPVWPMPGMEACLARLRERGRVWGVISNAQFFTPLLFPALVGRSLDDLGCDPHLRYYSYEHRHAKPDPTMYRLAAGHLESRGIGPAQVLYMGNDIQNDVRPAAEVGFHTVLFAGDARSLRLREDDPQLVGLRPTAVLTELAQLEMLLDE